MSLRHAVRIGPWLGLALITGCSSAQVLSVRTEPTGAHVYLQRRGDIEVQASVGGMSGEVGADSFEEEFYSLGTTPVEYEFDRTEKEGGVVTPAGGGSVTRRYREGTVRIELEGYRTVERVVRFSGDPVTLTETLQPRSPQ